MAVTYAFSIYVSAYGQPGLQAYIFDHDVFISPRDIQSRLIELGDRGRPYYLNMYLHGYDFLFPLTLSVFSFLLIAKALNGYPWSKLALILPPALFLADVAENITIISILQSYPLEPLWAYAYLGSTIALKSAIKWVVYSLLIVSIGTALVNKLNTYNS